MRTFTTAILAAGLLLTPAKAADLILNDLQRQAGIILYEMPDAEGRADTVRSIELIRNRFFPKVELVDAASLDDAALREKIKGGFILYTTLSGKSRLLPLVAQPVPLRLENGIFRWKDLTAPIAELRVVFAGKNPYGSGYSVVYAAGSNALLARANAVFHGPCSFHIYRGEQLLREGYYDQNFTERDDRLKLADAVADVHEFFSTLERIHPNLLARVSEQNYHRLKEQTLSGLAGRADKDGKVRVRDLEYLLTYAAAFFKDGHTFIRWGTKLTPEEVGGSRFPPFWLDSENGRFLIAAAKDPALQGMELTAVNGVPVREFLSPVLDRCSGETLCWKARGLTRNQAFWFWFTNLFGTSPAACKLKLRDAEGVESERAAETLSFAEYQKLKPAGAPSDPNETGTRVRFFDSGRVAHFIYPAFQSGEAEKKKIDEVFQQVKNANTWELILDLRGNGGGNSNMGDHIFRYLHAEPVQQVSDMRIKVTREVYEGAKKSGVPLPPNADALFAAHEGKTVSSRDFRHLMGESGERAVSRPKPEAFFSGRIYLLIDNGTFSSASMFAAAFRDYEIGKILGYETGGVPIAFGDVHAFTLKHSRIAGGVSYKQFFPFKPRPGDEEHGVLPDVPLNAKLLAPYRHDADAVLAFTLGYIRNARESASR